LVETLANTSATKCFDKTFSLQGRNTTSTHYPAKHAANRRWNFKTSRHHHKVVKATVSTLSTACEHYVTINSTLATATHMTPCVFHGELGKLQQECDLFGVRFRFTLSILILHFSFHEFPSISSGHGFRFLRKCVDTRRKKLTLQISLPKPTEHTARTRSSCR
jgi:hypothetical protein